METNDIINQHFNDNYRRGSALLHEVFSTEKGRLAMEFLEELFYSNLYNSDKPSESALYSLGQCSVLHEIKDMVRKVENGYFNIEEDN